MTEQPACSEPREAAAAQIERQWRGVADADRSATLRHQDQNIMKTTIQLLAFALVAFGLVAAESTKHPFHIRLVQDSPGADTEQMTITHPTKDQGRTVDEHLHVQKAPLMDHRAVASAAVEMDVISGRPQIAITFTDKGRETFAEVTRKNVGRRLAIIVDGQLLSAPKIATEIPGGKAAISGNFSKEEAADLASKINAAAKR
jgi:preprotein translocase subunit SecD